MALLNIKKQAAYYNGSSCVFPAFTK